MAKKLISTKGYGLRNEPKAHPRHAQAQLGRELDRMTAKDKAFRKSMKLPVVNRKAAYAARVARSQGAANRKPDPETWRPDKGAPKNAKIRARPSKVARVARGAGRLAARAGSVGVALALQPSKLGNGELGPQQRAMIAAQPPRKRRPAYAQKKERMPAGPRGLR